ARRRPGDVHDSHDVPVNTAPGSGHRSKTYLNLFRGNRVILLAIPPEPLTQSVQIARRVGSGPQVGNDVVTSQRLDDVVVGVEHQGPARRRVMHCRTSADPSPSPQ